MGMANIRSRLRNLVLMALHLIVFTAYFHVHVSAVAEAHSRRNTNFIAATAGNNPYFKTTGRRLKAVTHGAVINVETYGALGNAIHDDTQALANAWSAACKTPAATLLVPRGKSFLVNNLEFTGPCEPGFTFQVDGTIVGLTNPGSWKNSDVWLKFSDLQEFTLSGSGTIDGQGKAWWANQCQTKNGHKHCNSHDRPKAMHFHSSTGVVIRGISLVNSPKFHLTLDGCENVQVLGLKISAPETSPNTDGIDLSDCKNVLISDCNIGTGDDCIAIGDGSSDITVKSLSCGPGHGVSVGSLGKDNSRAEVSRVTIDGATFTSTDNGLRIKTWQGGSGMAQDIVFKNVRMVDAKNPIIIDQYYCDSATPCANETSAVQVSKVTYSNISGTSASPVAVKFACSDTVACTDITMEDVSLSLQSGGEASNSCKNARGRAIGVVNPSSCLLS